MPTPSEGPTATAVPPPAIEIDPAVFKVQDAGDGNQEFFLDTRFGTIPYLPVQDGVDLRDYDLEFTFQGGDGDNVQLWYKQNRNDRWATVSSPAYAITTGEAIRYNPIADGREVEQFQDFAHIHGIGAKVFGNIANVKLTSAMLIRRQAGPAPLGLTIDSPSEEQQVDCQITVQGTLSAPLAEGQSLWLLIQPGQTQSLGVGTYHPQPGLIVVNNTWQLGVKVGACPGEPGDKGDVGRRFLLLLGIADQQADQAFRDYLQRGPQNGVWEGMKILPSGYDPRAKITVVHK
jgi:hypothetical protein